MVDMAYIEFRKVNAVYKGQAGGVRALREVSFAVDEGEKVCILGENGSGKSTLLRVLTGLMPYEGSVLIGGRELSSLKRRELSAQTALLTQLSSVYFSYSVWETVMMGRFLHTGNRSARGSEKDRRVVESCLERTGLKGLETRTLTELSGGQLQRVFLARTWAQETPVLLLDEPTNHLDLKYQAMLADDLEGWAGQDMTDTCGEKRRNTLIGVFHDVRLALKLADRVLVLKEGKLIYDGDPVPAIRSGVLDEAYGIDVGSYFNSFSSRWTEAMASQA